MFKFRTRFQPFAVEMVRFKLVRLATSPFILGITERIVHTIWKPTGILSWGTMHSSISLLLLLAFVARNKSTCIRKSKTIRKLENSIKKIVKVCLKTVHAYSTVMAVGSQTHVNCCMDIFSSKGLDVNKLLHKLTFSSLVLFCCNGKCSPVYFIIAVIFIIFIPVVN